MLSLMLCQDIASKGVSQDRFIYRFTSILKNGTSEKVKCGMVV